jgi:fatty acid desaturase
VLEYVALILLLIVLVMIFYGFIYLHELPYEIAKHRNHPQTEAIYVACWLSLFTLHAIWPIVFIWAISKPNPMKVAVTGGVPADPDWARRLGELEQRLRRIEGHEAPAVEPAAQTGGGKKATIGKGKA